MSTRVKVNMKPVNTILTRLGVDKNGEVQRFVTNTINHRITRYMPFRTGALATKLKMVKSSTEIDVLGPYARYQYYGKAMDGVAPKTVTDRDLQYDKTKNPQAGPLWDRRMMAAEGKQIAAETQAYIDRGKK
jgi:hypothetical protein